MLNKLKSEEILTYLFLIVIGYFIAKMFSRVCMNRVNRFSVGGQDDPTWRVQTLPGLYVFPHPCSFFAEAGNQHLCTSRHSVNDQGVTAVEACPVSCRRRDPPVGAGGRGRGYYIPSPEPPPPVEVEERNGIRVSIAYGNLPPLESTCSQQKMATTPTLLGRSGADRAEIARRTSDCRGKWEEEWIRLNTTIGSDGRDGRSRQEMINHDWSYFGT